jgi:phosphatidate cytidylyltransferase
LKDDAVLYSTLLILPGIALLAVGVATAIVVTIAAVIFFLIRETFLFESMPDEEPAKEVLCAFGATMIYPFLLGMSFISVIQKISSTYFQNSWQVILWFVLLIIASDTGAYFGGKLLGKHKLAPRISPAKTIEGAVSGFIAVLISSATYLYFFNFYGDYLLPSIVTLLVAVLAPVGDLVESWVKRIYAVKDMGSILPGHGGVFDRVDSYIFAAPALYFLTISL